MNSIRFLLVNPINTLDPDEACFSNLGLGYIISAIRHEMPFKRGHTVEFKIVNSGVDKIIREWQPHLVGITSVSQYYNRAIGYAKIAKRYNLPVIVGGTHISALPETMTTDMDISIIGEGEKTIVELIAIWTAEGKLYPNHLAEVDGIAYHDNKEVRITKPRALIQPLDNILHPSRDISAIGKFTSMFTSRGCPYRCTYCFSSRFWNKVRFFSAEYVVNEIELLYKGGVRQISLLDDLFITDIKRLGKIIDLLSNKNLLRKISYICNVRSNLITNDLARMLYNMNVKYVGMGIESGCQSTLEYLKGKGNITVEDHARAIQVLKNNNIHTHPSFIIGSPFEDKDNVLETIKFIKDNDITDFEIYVLVPFPGTPIWEYAKAHGLVSNTIDWNRLYWNFGRNPNPVILSEKLSEQEIRGFYNQLIDRRKRYIKEYQIRNIIKQGAKHPMSVPKYILRRCANVLSRGGIQQGANT